VGARQSASLWQPITHACAIGSQNEPAGQSAFVSHCTHRPLVTSQIGVAGVATQSALE
jgi:hypothetical protein